MNTEDWAIKSFMNYDTSWDSKELDKHWFSKNEFQSRTTKNKNG